MTDHLPSKDEVSIREVIAELKHDLGSADAGPWEIYTSNSYRRVGLAGTYKPVVYPTVHADGQPDIAGFQNLRAMVESFNAAPRLMAEIDRLNALVNKLSIEHAWAVGHARGLRTTLRGISTCSTCEACRGAALRALGNAAPTSEQNAEHIAWALRVHEDLAEYVAKGGGNMLHCRANRAFGFLFAEIERLEKILYPIRAAQPPGDG